jgi:hypothetical protein
MTIVRRRFSLPALSSSGAAHQGVRVRHAIDRAGINDAI